MSKTITVFEDRLIQVHLTDTQKRELFAFEQLWGSQNFNLRADGKVLLRRYVGFVATPSLQLQILPKIYENGASSVSGDTEVAESVDLLFRLLHFSGFTSVKNIPNPQEISQHHSDLFEVFISIFVNQFLQMFSRHVHRQYEERVENMTFIKGKILFHETILRNVGSQHNHFVRYGEFTEDNLLNQIFKAVMLSLRQVTRSSQNKAKITIALTYLEDVRTIRLTSHVLQTVRFTRLNEVYRPLFNMAKMFYYNRQPGLSGGDQYTFTFLVPLNQLFEYTLFMLIERGLAHTSYEVQYQSPQKYLDGDAKLLLRPDIVVIDESGCSAIVDAKYKNPIVNGAVNPSKSDIYQLLAYAVRYGCNRVFLAYPRFKGYEVTANPMATYHIKDQDKLIVIQAIGIDLKLEDAVSASQNLVQDLGFSIVLDQEYPIYGY